MTAPPEPGPEIEVRRALAADEPELRRQLARWKIVHDPDRRFDWIYHHNPQGRAVAWLAHNRSGEVVGFTSVFPRAFRVDGEPVLGSVGFDAFVRPDHRRMGIAASLHRATLREMRERTVPFRFMFGPPAPANLGALVKIGARVVGHLRVHVRPLTAEGAFAMSHYAGPGSRVIARAARLSDLATRPVLRLAGRALAGPVRATLWTTAEPALDALWEEATSRHRIAGRRDSAYLRWRYGQNPVCRQEVVLLESGLELLGFAVIELAPQGALVVDHVLPPGRVAAARAIEAVAGWAADRGASRIAIRLSLESPERHVWRLAGFLPGRQREELQVLCPEEKLLERLSSFGQWHFTTGDLNPEATHWSVVTSPREAFSDANYVEPRAGQDQSPRAGRARPRSDRHGC